jgi:hypothetical protein
MIGLPLALPLYPPGFLWGSRPAEFPSLVPHPESHLHGLHPYPFMIIVLYVAWGPAVLCQKEVGEDRSSHRHGRSPTFFTAC